MLLIDNINGSWRMQLRRNIGDHTNNTVPVPAIQPRGDVTAGWVVAAAAMAVVTVTTVVGNAVVLLALRRVQRAPAHFPLASLATADLLVGVSVLPIAAARELFIFHLPWPVCACWSTLDVLCCTASILSICALGWERWNGITAPLARAKRHRRAKLSAALVWPVSTVIALPTAYIPSQKHHILGEMMKACTVNTNVGYVFGSITGSFYLPASVMVFLYARILRSLSVPPPIRSHRGRVSRLKEDKNSLQGNNGSDKTSKSDAEIKTQAPVKLTIMVTPKRTHLAFPKQPSELCPVPSPLKASNSPGGIIPRQRRATRTIVMLMSLFLICWTPFFIMLPADSLCECVWDATWLWCTWLGYANSALNPLVYAAGSPSVRRALRGTLSTFTSSQTCSSSRITQVPMMEVRRVAEEKLPLSPLVLEGVAPAVTSSQLVQTTTKYS